MLFAVFVGRPSGHRGVYFCAPPLAPSLVIIICGKRLTRLDPARENPATRRKGSRATRGFPRSGPPLSISPQQPETPPSAINNPSRRTAAAATTRALFCEGERRRLYHVADISLDPYQEHQVDRTPFISRRLYDFRSLISPAIPHPLRS